MGAALFCLVAAPGALAAPFAYIPDLIGPELKVIDTANNAVVASIRVGRTAYGVAVNRAGTRVYITNAGDGTVSAIDTATNRVVATIAVTAPIGIAVDPAGTRVYVSSREANPAGDAVAVIDAGTHAVVGKIRVGAGPHGLAVSPDGRRLYVANELSNSISVVDTATLAAVATIPLPAEPYAVAIDADGARVYVTFRSLVTALVAIDTAANAVVGEMASFGSGLAGIALDPAGARAYAASAGEDTGGNSVFVIDTASLAVVATVRVGGGPIGVSMHPSGTRVYAANSDSGSVSVIDAATTVVIATVPVGGVPHAFGNFVGPAGFALEAANYQGLWWKSPAGSESGWGVNITHQGDILFATWFTYAADGSGLWLVMSNGAKSGPGTYSGTLHRTTGPAFDASPWDPAAVSATPVGTGTFAFADGDNGTFTYTVDGRTRSKAITRQLFASPMPTCMAGGTAGSGLAYFQDLWWRSPAGSQSGWGVNLTHQGDTLFATWFTYGPTGEGQWLVMSNGARTGAATYSGTLFRTTGPAFDAEPWDPARVTTTAVGSATFSFIDSANGTFAYSLDGTSRSHPIVRQVYSQPATVCR